MIFFHPMRIFIVTFIMFITFSFSVTAASFKSLSKDTVYMRYGPSTDHPIKWVYEKRGLPVEVVAEFDQWLKVRDFSGEDGWIHKSLLSSKTYGVVHNAGERTYILMHKKGRLDSEAILRIEDGALMRIHECDSLFCKVTVSSHKGYVEKKYIWGIAQSQ